MATRTPQPRTLNFAPATGDLPAVLSLTVGKESCNYAFREIRCDIGGRAFELWKLDIADMTTYHVRCGEAGKHASCECKGFLRWGYCKHVEAIAEMGRRGLLPALPEPEPEPLLPVYHRNPETCEWTDEAGNPIPVDDYGRPLRRCA